jgi:hypothetical protein
MAADSEDQDLQDVMAEEKSRGVRRRTLDTSEQKKKRTAAKRRRHSHA